MEVPSVSWNERVGERLAEQSRAEQSMAATVDDLWMGERYHGRRFACCIDCVPVLMGPGLLCRITKQIEMCMGKKHLKRDTSKLSPLCDPWDLTMDYYYSCLSVCLRA